MADYDLLVQLKKVDTTTATATEAKTDAAAAKTAANEAKHIADSAVKTVNGERPVNGNVSLTIPGLDHPQAYWESIGSYISATQTGGTPALSPGQTQSAANLRVYSFTGTPPSSTIRPPYGTWRLHSHLNTSSQIAIWQRIE